MPEYQAAKSVNSDQNGSFMCFLVEASSRQFRKQGLFDQRYIGPGNGSRVPHRIDHTIPIALAEHLLRPSQ
jgi:hypothetical protein